LKKKQQQQPFQQPNPRNPRRKSCFSSLVKFSTPKAATKSSPPPQTPQDKILALVASTVHKQEQDDTVILKLAEEQALAIKMQGELAQEQARTIDKHSLAIKKQGDFLASFTESRKDRNATLKLVAAALTPQKPRHLFNDEADDDEAEGGIGYVNSYESPEAMVEGIEDDVPEEQYESAA